MSVTDVASTVQDAQASCDTASIVVLIALCLAGIVVTFLGYRLYKRFLALLGFVILFSVEGSFGMAWVEQAPGAETEKKVVVLICCVAWGVIGSLLIVRYAEVLQRRLGFILGAALGIVLVYVLIYATKEDLDRELGPDYKGWDIFALCTLGLPAALLFGFLLRNLVKYALMFGTASGGAFATIWCLIAVCRCREADLGPFSEHKYQVVLMLALAALGVIVQVFTDPERRAVVKGPGPCNV